MSTGNQFYPGASTAYRYDGTYKGLMQEINCCVTHTTEGTTLPSYGGGASAPNVTLLPDIANKRLKVYAHFPADMSARALVDDSNTAVRTNRNNCHQVELVGTCDPTKRTSWGTRRAGVDYIFWPEAPDWALREYARYIAWLYTEHKVPLASTSKPWLAYPSSYGSRNGQRMSLAEWAVFKGHCGHQHVPDGNDHGDPGNMDMLRVIQYAKELVPGGQPPTTPPTPQPSKPVVDLSKLIAAAKADPPKTGTPVSYSGVKVVEAALAAEGHLARHLVDGHFGTATRSAYSAWQRRLGYAGADADGIPGLASLTALGKKRGFNVTA
ncbi:hypothetical protein [Streptomyces sp. NPDC012888]|uniref:hypothetical protein n=1 Tax=Streptomyces sp. NPDC012888 TaxID=3364855 RepID=UPI0036AFB2B1